MRRCMISGGIVVLILVSNTAAVEWAGGMPAKKLNWNGKQLRIINLAAVICAMEFYVTFCLRTVNCQAKTIRMRPG